MKTLILWIILAIFSFPLALLVLIIYPIILLLLLPFRLLGFTIEVILDLLKAIILFPPKLIKLI